MPNAEPYAIWKTDVLSAADFASLPERERLAYVCLLGHLAPNTHNTQPWKFYIDESSPGIHVYLDRGAVLPASDVAGRQSVISIGCAIENMVAGAEALGFSTRVTVDAVAKELLLPESAPQPRYVRVASLSFAKEENAAGSENLLTAIFTRRVMRAEYDPTRPIEPDVIKKMEGSVDGETVRLHTVSDPLRRLSIAEFQAQADGYVINSKKFSRELGDWLLPNNTGSAVGMPGDTFGLDDEQARRMHEGLVGKQPLQPEDGLRFALGGKIGMEKSPAIFFLTAGADDAAHWIATGRALERMFLLLTAYGYATTVHAGIVEVLLINKMFAMTFGTTRRIMALFRAGRLKNPSDASRPHSPRQPLEHVILAEPPFAK